MQGSFGVHTLLGEQAALLQTSTLIEDAITFRGDPARFAAFTDIPALRSAISVMDAWDGSPKTARAWSPSSGTPFQIFATREQLRTLYDAGFLIVLEDVERFVPALQPLCRALEKDLGLATDRVNVEVFCALKGGLGRPHFDPSPTTNQSLTGSIRLNDRHF